MSFRFLSVADRANSRAISICKRNSSRNRNRNSFICRSENHRSIIEYIFALQLARINPAHLRKLRGCAKRAGIEKIWRLASALESEVAKLEDFFFQKKFYCFFFDRHFNGVGRARHVPTVL